MRKLLSVESCAEDMRASSALPTTRYIPSHRLRTTCANQALGTQ